MTALAKSAIANPYSAKFVQSLPGRVPAALVSTSVAWTTIMFAQDTGGRGPMSLTKAAIPLLLALIAVRPWRRVRVSVLVAAAAVAVAALTICVVTPPGWFGANRAASYAMAAATFVTVAAYVRRTSNVYWIASVLTVAGGIQFFRALVPWWGSRDPSSVMVGTFYWHNQFGAFLLMPAILGLGLIVANRAPYRLVGWIITPFAAAGVLFSASRGSELALAVGWVLVGVLSACARRNLRGLIARWLLASALAGAMPFVLTGPLFFSSWHLPWASTQARGATGETLEQNSSVRIYFWRQALIVFEHHPVDGVGYGALSNEAMKLTPPDWPRSPLAHDDYLQSLADGGMVLGIPFLLSCGAIAFVLLRRTWMLLRRGTTDPLRIAVVTCAMALMAHAAIDFDWSYPALFAAVAAVTGLACAGGVRVASRVGARRTSVRAGVFGLTAVLVAAVIVGAVSGRHGGLTLVYHGSVAATGAEGVR